MQTIINNPQNNLKYYFSKKIVVIFFIIAILIIALFIFIAKSSKRTSNNTIPNSVINNLPADNPTRLLAEKRDRPSFGNPDAKLVIVEFSDFQCPVCQAEFPIIREVINEHKNELLYIYRQYPIINENSPVVSQASLCANEQNKFWPMHDRLFLNASDTFSQNDLITIAKQSGLNENQFSNCLSSEKYNDQVTEDFQDGYALQVPGTPTFFINGNKLSGKISKENWEIIINQSLKLLNH